MFAMDDLAAELSQAITNGSNCNAKAIGAIRMVANTINKINDRALIGMRLLCVAILFHDCLLWTSTALTIAKA